MGCRIAAEGVGRVGNVEGASTAVADCQQSEFKVFAWTGDDTGEGSRTAPARNATVGCQGDRTTEGTALQADRTEAAGRFLPTDP